MNDQEEYLIAYSNIKSGLIKNQKDFASDKDLILFFNKKNLGFPICLPKKIKYFDYSKAKYFSIDKRKFSRKMFNTNKISYIGNKKFFRYGNIFAYNVLLKKKYLSKFNFYNKHTKSVKEKIKNLKKKSKICSMQIRNVPHLGHEAIFKYIVKKFDLLVLNPIYGIKKSNDFNYKTINKALKFIEKKYKKNIIFLPFWCNFHYAGPREALHHMQIRELLGFDYFYVGRDHAGAEKLYPLEAAINFVLKYKNKFKIRPVTSKGGYYCTKCLDYVVKGSCKHKKLLNISGTDFRKSIKNKKIFIHADLALQKAIKNKVIYD